MMKLLIKLFLILSLALLLTSCGKSVFKNSDSKEEYLNAYSSLSLDEKKKKMSQDLADLDSLRDFANGIYIYYSFSMSGGAVSDSLAKAGLESEEPFTINANEDSAKVAFSTLTESLYLNQNLQTPESEIEIDIPEKDANGGKTASKITKLFSKGKEINQKKIGLRKVDSALVTATYSYPSSLTRFEIASGKNKKIAFGKDIIEIKKWENNALEIQIPQQMNQDLLAYQAVDEDGILMNPNSNSSFPVMSIQKSILLELEKTKEIFKKASKSNSEKEFTDQLNQLPKTVFDHKNRILELEDAMEKASKESKSKKKKKDGDSLENFGDVLKPIKKLMADFSDIFAAETQQVEMSFPNKVSKVYFYLGKDYKTLSKNITAINETTDAPYELFYDTEKKKYGIADSIGNVIVKPEIKERMYYVEGKVFRNDSDNSTYILDVDKKRMKKIENRSYVKTIDIHRMVFSDKTEKQGVLDDNEKVIIPFEYKSIIAVGNIYAGEKSIRGRTYYQILDKNGKILIDRVAVAIPSAYNDGLVIVDMDKKFGLLDVNGNFSIKPQNAPLSVIGKGPVLSYTIEGSDGEDRTGIMDSKGKKLSPPIFASVRDLSDGIALAKAYGEYDYDYEYVTLSGKKAFEGSYVVAYPFYNGFAVTATEDDRFSIINKTGKVVFSVPVSAGLYSDTRKEGNNLIFEFSNETFNSKNFLNK